MEIIGEGSAQGIRCHLKFLPYSYFSKDTQRKVTGVVENANGKVLNLVKLVFEHHSHKFDYL